MTGDAGGTRGLQETWTSLLAFRALRDTHLQMCHHCADAWVCRDILSDGTILGNLELTAKGSTDLTRVEFKGYPTHAWQDADQM